MGSEVLPTMKEIAAHGDNAMLIRKLKLGECCLSYGNGKEISSETLNCSASLMLLLRVHDAG